MAFPVPPTSPVLDNLKDTSFRATSNHGGSGILERRFWLINENDVWTQHTTSNTNPFSFTFTGLIRNHTYRVSAVVRNADGWSTPSNERSIRTYASYTVPPAPDAPIATKIDQTSIALSFTDNGNSNFTILEREIGYSTTSTGWTATKDATNANPALVTLTGLTPGVMYYFWSRVRTEVGWSAWSARSQAETIAGAWVNVNGVWKKAVPYVNVAGTWKLARPWTKIAGVWKEDG